MVLPSRISRRAWNSCSSPSGSIADVGSSATTSFILPEDIRMNVRDAASRWVSPPTLKISFKFSVYVYMYIYIRKYEPENSGYFSTLSTISFSGPGGIGYCEWYTDSARWVISSNPWSSFLTTPRAPPFSAAIWIRSLFSGLSGHSGSPTAIFSDTVKGNNKWSWVKSAVARRRSRE